MAVNVSFIVPTMKPLHINKSVDRIVTSFKTRLYISLDLGGSLTHDMKNETVQF